jgi:hypothetical protein
MKYLVKDERDLGPYAPKFHVVEAENALAAADNLGLHPWQCDVQKCSYKYNAYSWHAKDGTPAADLQHPVLVWSGLAPNVEGAKILAERATGIKYFVKVELAE